MNDNKSPFVKTAWVLIILFVGLLIVLQAIPDEADNSGNTEDSTGLVIAQLQAEFILAQGVMSGSSEAASAGAIVLDAGTVAQRQRYIAFMIGLDDLEAAKLSALRMQTELTSEKREMSQQQAKTQEMLNILVKGGELPEDHESLEGSLGWFGSFVEADVAERKKIENSVVTKVTIVMVAVLVVAIAAIIGLVFLIIKAVKAFDGKIKSGLASPSTHHGVYAEVFALWLLVFVGLQTLAGMLSKVVANGSATIELSLVLSAFFGSLVVLFWGRVRGVPFEQIREDIGWTTGNGVIREIFAGFAGYAMTLPILGIGILITLLLFVIQQLLSGGAEASQFQSTGGGAHPIVVDIAKGVWATKILLIFMAAVVAPVVEETIFRGVLYRHLRSSFKFRAALSIICSVLLVSFVFAVIHPQGWIAIPALMGIAVGMNLLREWRGSLIPSMVVHGVSNGIVVSIMVLMLS